MFAHVVLSSLCAFLIIFFTCIIFSHIFKAVLEMHENIYCTKISTFTVYSWYQDSLKYFSKESLAKLINCISNFQIVFEFAKC